MRIIAIKTLKTFWQTRLYRDSEQTLKAWFGVTEKADWKAPAAVKRAYGNASVLKNSRVVFNIHGNKYRLVTYINYPYRVVYIRFIGTHEQYDKIDAEIL